MPWLVTFLWFISFCISFADNCKSMKSFIQRSCACFPFVFITFTCCECMSSHTDTWSPHLARAWSASSTLVPFRYDCMCCATVKLKFMGAVCCNEEHFRNPILPRMVTVLVDTILESNVLVKSTIVLVLDLSFRCALVLTNLFHFSFYFIFVLYALFSSRHLYVRSHILQNIISKLVICSEPFKWEWDKLKFMLNANALWCSRHIYLVAKSSP